MRIFRRWGLPDLLPVLETPLQLYLVAVEKHYPDSNPYHNKLHACEMTQALHWFLQQCDQVLQLSPLEKFSTLFAGVVHDLGHPGLNNHFLCATRSKLSLTYNDISVLENWHASQAFELLLSRPEFNFTANFPEDMYQEFRALVVQLVLATDMAKHVEILGMWRSSTVAHVDLSDATSRLLALKLLTKCADLANVARPWLLCHEWADRVVAEFRVQGDKEVAAGIPVSPFMGRDADNIAKMQIAFTQFVANPLYESVHKVMPLPEAMQHLAMNLRMWNLANGDM
eukprot:TRINITY_DN1507_c0_g1_i7.p1 TRINITY_DN1507_c0_g1~~TRINITY_DN1507_c0_g1_i7.p1  ORF type:complete len:284 (+),score=65.67 TRINITY_DN1507_c0_g1_i7:191-1042(+)